MSSEPALDFDQGAAWLPSLHQQIAGLLPADFPDRLERLAPEGPFAIQAALPQLFGDGAVFAAVREWITKRNVVVYHGTRISERQRSSILRDGLRPLVAADRIDNVAELLGEHPRWAELEPRVPDAIEWVRRNAGSREGMVYGSLSRAGMLRTCNHYLVEGSEFDGHVVARLLGDGIHQPHPRPGIGSLVVFRADGAAAIDAADPRADPGCGTSLIEEVTAAVGWWLAAGDDDTAAFDVDCALLFHGAIPAKRIEAIIPVLDAELWEYYDRRND